MTDILYSLMDWRAIEELVYSESCDPHRILGPHVVPQGVLIQAFIPTASRITVLTDGDGHAYPMELADEAGFFAALLPGAAVPAYTLEVTYDNGTSQLLSDPYAYAPQLDEGDLKKFDAGVLGAVYEKLGAHPMEIGGVRGTYFAVWAPCAMRVSVVGDFNLWDGRRHQMRRLGSHGIFEIFLPGIAQGTIYKYEVKTAGGAAMLKADPYGTYAEVRPHDASIVWDTSHFEWHDQEWMKRRAEGRETAARQPMSIYEVHLGSWMRRRKAETDGGAGAFLNYRELAVKLAEYVKEMGYTHVELMPIMEHPLDASWGYQTTGYYAPTSRHGSPDDFQYFIDYLHSRDIGVILDWTPAQFPRDLAGLACFDGSCVYEHKDPRQGTHPQWGTLIFNYGRPQVANFLISNALFWTGVYHADGIRADCVAAMLYLDYGKGPGQWIPNIYGGNENLDAVDFLRRLSACFHKREDGAVLIAEESAAWPLVTGNEDGALGFDYKWNSGWLNDFLGYMRYDPYFRHQRYGELTFSMLYAYSEAFILALPHHEMAHGRGSMAGKMPGGTLAEKLAHLRAAYGYWMTHPGKKLLFMGQDMGMTEDWNENVSLPWEMPDGPSDEEAGAPRGEKAGGPSPEEAGAPRGEKAGAPDGAAGDQRILRRQFRDYVRALLQLYRSHPALYALDDQPDGFEWIDCLSSQENILAYLRLSAQPRETLLAVCNFAPAEHSKRQIGVPFAGRYREIFNSSAREFGGNGVGNPKEIQSVLEECDGRAQSVTIRIPPLSILIFACTPDESAGKADGRQKK